MRTVKQWRFIPFEKLSAYENMATDEYMINWYQKEKIPVLRVYSWNPPAISIGKNQNALSDLDLENCAEDFISIVRRITGGGAIYHDSELTYSLVCSEADISEEKLSVKESFEKLNAFLTEMYGRLGLKAVFARDFYKQKKLGEHSAFCFGENEEYDIIIKKKKIGGNAQCRKKDVVFQHGSIPLEFHEEKIKRYFNNRINFQNFAGVKWLTKKPVDVKILEKTFLDAFREVHGVTFKEQPLKDREKEKVDKLVMNKYSSDEWNIKGERIEPKV